MPELPEVERFRQLLLPLTNSSSLSLERPANAGYNKRIALTDDDLAKVSSSKCTDVIRKGKQLCLVLQSCPAGENEFCYLMLHMGMTGNVRVPGVPVNWGGKKVSGEDVTTDLMVNDDDDHLDDTNAPKYTQLVFETPTYTAYFCDPRKFGSCSLESDMSTMEALAPDALLSIDDTVIQTNILPRLTQQRLGIKAILLDQKRAVAGVGNWVADEVLYQCELHPDQSYLTEGEAQRVWESLHSIVTQAVDSLERNTHYPVTWLFNYRWTKKKAGKDALGRAITFVKSGGRTSAIIAKVQRLYKRKGSPSTSPIASNVKSHDETVATAYREVQSHTGKRKLLQKFKHGEEQQPPKRVTRRSQRRT